MRHFIYLKFIFCILFLSFSPTSFAQSDSSQMNARFKAIEDYVQQFPIALEELSINLENSLQGYTQNLDASLKQFSNRLKLDMEQQFEQLRNNRVILNPKSKAFQTIQTNSGNFLISINRTESIDGGIRVHFNIGNPHYADFRDFKLKLFWGQTFEASNAKSFDEWQNSLLGAEFKFDGLLKKGMWNHVTVDIVPVKYYQIEHMECEMEVLGIELQKAP